MNHVKAHLDKITKALTGKRHMSQLELARKEYYGATGEIYEDDPSFEMRMIMFLEWFVFDRPLAAGDVPIREYLEEHAQRFSAAERELTEALLRQRHGLFRVKKMKPPVLHLKDLWTGKTVRVEAGEITRSFQADDLLDARLVVFRDKTWFTEGILCHPPMAEPYIKAELKALRKSGESGPESLFLKLSAMLLKYERSRGIKPELIYRNA